MQNKAKVGKIFFDGASALAVATVVTKILGLLYKAPLSRILGDEGMGYFNSAYTVYTFFYILCSAGVPKAITIIISENDAKNRRANEKGIIRSALLAFLLLGVTLTALFIGFSDEICGIIKNNGALLTMLTIAPSILFVSLAGVAKGYLNGNSRLVPLAVSQLIEGSAKFFLGIAFAIIGARRGMPLPLLSAFTVLGITLGSIFSALYLLICAKRVIPRDAPVYRNNPVGIVKRIFKIAFPLTLSAAVMSISNMVDLVTIMDRLHAIGYDEASASALYGNYTTLAVPMFNLIVALVSPFFIAALPMLSRSYSSNDRQSFEGELGIALKKSFFIAVPSCFAFIFYSKEILSIIFEREAAELGAPLLTFLAPSLIFLTGQSIINTALEATGHYKAPIITMLIGVVPKLAASYFLISNEAVGIAGAPIGTVLCYASGFLASVLILYTQTDLHAPVFRELLRPFAASVGAAAISELLKNCMTEKLPELAFSVITVIIFGFLYLVFYAFSLVWNRNKWNYLSKCTKKSS